MAIFCSRILDYIFMMICILVFVTSTILNPLVFWFRFPKLSSNVLASSLLFSLLSVSDFLTNITFPIIMFITLAKPTQEPLLRPATRLDQIHFVLFRTLGGASAILTSMLAVTRWLRIRYPMMRIKNKVLIGHLVFFSVGPIFGAVTWSVLRCPLSTSQWSTNYQTVITDGCGFLTLAAHWVIIAHAWFGLIVSLITTIRLNRSFHPATAAHTRQSIITILIMNLVISVHTVVSITVMIVGAVGGRRIDWSTGVTENPEEAPMLSNISLYYITPLVMSSANPIIIFCCNKRIRLFTRIKLSIVKDRTISDTH